MGPAVAQLYGPSTANIAFDHNYLTIHTIFAMLEQTNTHFHHTMVLGKPEGRHAVLDKDPETESEPKWLIDSASSFQSS